MRAALFDAIGTAPIIREVPDPIAESGDAVIEIVSASVLPYAREIFSGQRPMLFELPFVPGSGAVGRVHALGSGATALKVGDWVYCDPTLRARDASGLAPIVLQGLTAGGPDALALQRQYPNGSWAQLMRVPLENAIPLGSIDASDASSWLAMGSVLVPYGGLLAVDLRAGEVVLINGATGNFGSAGVAAALAMGASRVIATGRNEAALQALRDRYGDRVVGVRATGALDDTTAFMAAAGTPIDVVLDILPPAASPAQVMTAILAVRPGGRTVLMGGVAASANLAIPYTWLMRNNITVRGQWMYPREAIFRAIAMFAAGTLRRDVYEITEFAIDDVSAAIAHAADNAGPFNKTMLCPAAS